MALQPGTTDRNEKTGMEVLSDSAKRMLENEVGNIIDGYVVLNDSTQRKVLQGLADQYGRDAVFAYFTEQLRKLELYLSNVRVFTNLDILRKRALEEIVAVLKSQTVSQAEQVSTTVSATAFSTEQPLVDLDVPILVEILEPAGQTAYSYTDDEIARLLSPIITDQAKLDQVIAFYAKMLASQPKNTDHQTQDNRDRIARLQYVIDFIQSQWSHLRNQTN